MKNFIKTLIPSRLNLTNHLVHHSAPINIALIKYWGKIDEEFHLPCNSSLSISIKNLRSYVTLSPIYDIYQHQIWLNDTLLELSSSFSQRLIKFLNLFDLPQFLNIKIKSDVPIASGLASSSAGFAAIVLALNDMYGLHLDQSILAILARLGSGSATRSINDGFVQWPRDERSNPFNSFGRLLAPTSAMPDFSLGLLILDHNTKYISSRDAMKIVVQTSALYDKWIERAECDFIDIKEALSEQNFMRFAQIAQNNSDYMHQVNLSANPVINFSSKKTLETIQFIQELNQQGLPVFYTQDAGSNLKLLYKTSYYKDVKKYFPHLIDTEL